LDASVRALAANAPLLAATARELAGSALGGASKNLDIGNFLCGTGDDDVVVRRVMMMSNGSSVVAAFSYIP
jgi:hypothetical protein